MALQNAWLMADAYRAHRTTGLECCDRVLASTGCRRCGGDTPGITEPVPAPSACTAGTISLAHGVTVGAVPPLLIGTLLR